MERIPAGLKLRQLQYFLAVADCLHFSRAAERLAATQPTLSHQIAQMEAHLGAVLFDREGKRVRLTQAGEVLRDFVIRALKELEAGCVALNELEGLQRGSLSIGVIQSFSRTLLPPILGSFLSQYPKVKVSVEELTANEIEHRLAAGTIDLGIGFASLKLDDTEVEPVLEERLLLVVSSRHQFAGRKSVAMAELDRQPMTLLGTDFSTRRLIDGYLAAAGATPEVACETNSMEIMLGAVSCGNVATIIPERGLRLGESMDLRAVPLIDPVPVRTSALLWPRHSYRTIAARTFGRLMSEELRGGGRPLAVAQA
jgi:LysR family cyn operon transcriptional activator